MLAMVPASLASALSWAVVGTAAGPWTASAACSAALGEVCWLVGVLVGAVAGRLADGDLDALPCGALGELQPTASTSAVRATPAAAPWPARLRQLRRRPGLVADRPHVTPVTSSAGRSGTPLPTRRRPRP
ncbi:MAG TPA: hypothetical protein VEH05_16320 [Streptosporangiaceae bacterium]|nr:hypothetical protein [Streptosporangiaceae bacterium]